MNAEVLTQGVLSHAEDAYCAFGEYVNSYRLIPGIDGLIPVDRRILLAAPKEMSRSVVTVARTLEKYHPHGSAAPSKLVRQGMLLGTGYHGVDCLLESLPAAAERYTSAGRQTGHLANVIYRHTAFVESYQNEAGINEPKYLPIPIPHCLTTGHVGIGLGIATRIPAFSRDSLAKAALNNDWRELKAPEGLTINVEESELSTLWATGRGAISYAFNVEWSGKQGGAIISGNASLFKPRIGIFNDLIASGKIEIIDRSVDKLDLLIRRTKGTRVISDEEILKMCQRASTKRHTYSLIVNWPDNVVKLTPLSAWLKTSRQYYENAFALWQAKAMSDIDYNIQVANLLPPVAEKFRGNKTDDKILKEMGLPLTKALLETIKSKPLRMLRKTDFSAEIKKLELLKQAVSIQTPLQLIKDAYNV